MEMTTEATSPQGPCIQEWGSLVLVIVVEVWGQYMIVIRCLDAL